MAMETVAVPTLLILNALGLAWGALRWFGARGIKKADETLAKLETLEKSVDQLLHVLKAIERMDAKLDAYGTRIGEQDRKVVEQDIRLRMLEAEHQRLLQHVDDLSGFLTREGFKKRESGG